MIVCSCEAVTDGTIRKLVREGACTPGQIELACAAGARCGGCRETIRRLLRTERPAPDPVVAQAS